MDKQTTDRHWGEAKSFLWVAGGWASAGIVIGFVNTPQLTVGDCLICSMISLTIASLWARDCF